MTRTAMGFYHPDGFVPAWNFAKRYAGPDGRIATLPDIVDARLAGMDGDASWSTFFVTASAEYYGVGADGRKKLIVAHGVGPLATLDGIVDAYIGKPRDRSRNTDSGRITAEEFLKLEAGFYGEVEIVDMDSYVEFVSANPSSYRNKFKGLQDPLLLARLGKRATEYLQRHQEITKNWCDINYKPSFMPMIINNSEPDRELYTTFPKVNSSYDYSQRVAAEVPEGFAIAHLLVISDPHVLSAWNEDRPFTSLTSEITCMAWDSNIRLVGVPRDVNWMHSIDEAPSAEKVLREQWSRFMEPNNDADYVPPRFYRLERQGDEYFTRYPKASNGFVMDDPDVEFHVRSVEVVSSVLPFDVKELFFVRYSMGQIASLAPRGANAYMIVHVGRPNAAGWATISVQFYQADVDTTRRLPHPKAIQQDYDRIMVGIDG